ncbi:MAG: PAS domain S-box protein [Pseudodesulfovibrio sp.]|uniref:PAS sensor protein n=1 Tax=Pseudodesulfovibrio aespoeensis (strain ATCC 700646 / DSM 10631 / Aspo-2) TaxID=643562 RepID=E6VRQ6_PSEA9|nr:MULTISPECIES: PAS domain S-box protein [Pseudodesulfovibrio]MBU4191084.1 PAS domain S-box protein [Pseudomonadota bacterium]ADU64193.1 PAS sensor protein [Pseudodesulfovibrio aespoeensis Aspo-2]MBU4245389.1 PAS domain S-box protein [Pseudomonadota bacterium]MBU4377565.1 PAS domain S-box protein [Pseudomonadota bacterium]MBU4474641.1 PAS domain S-box protein [Pseudomonadota bacterium]
MNPHLFAQVLSASGVAMAIRDKNLRPIFANQAFTGFYGYSLAEIVGGRAEDILPGKTQSLLDQTVRPMVRAGQSWEGEYAIRTASGRLCPVWGRFDPVLDDAGRLTHVISIMRDASASLRLRNALTQSERHLHFLTENTRDCLFRLRVADRRFDYISPAVQSITGYSPQEFYEIPGLFDRLMPGEWAGVFDLWWREMLDGVCRDEYEFPLIHKDGSLRWINQRVTLDREADGTATALEGILSDITRRHEAQEMLAVAQKSLNFISSSTSDIFFRMAIPEGTYDYLSPSVEKFSGYPLAEYQAQPLFVRELIHPDWHDYFRKTWAELCRGVVRSEYVFQFIHKSGEVRWARQRVVMHKDTQGNPIAIEGMASDATEYMHTVEALRKSEARFRALFEDSPISLWEEDLTRLKAHFDTLKARGVTDFRAHFSAHPEDLARCAALVDVVAVNKATLQLLRAESRGDLLGNLDKVLTESSMNAFTEEMIVLASGGHEYCGEITHRTLDGQIIWVMVHFSVPPEHRQTLSRVIVSLLDVTPRKRAEQALMESEGRYRALVENAQEGVAVIQGQSILFINDAMTHVFGYARQELQALNPLQLIHPDDMPGIREQVAIHLGGRKAVAFAPFRVVTGDGGIKWVTLSIKPIMWNGQQAHLEILADVTGHKLLEEELRAAHAEVENRVRLRTAELSEANTRLMAEAEERRLAQERILSLTQQLIHAQENERQRIARDLHDKVAQDLSSIVLNMETLFDGCAWVDEVLRQRGEAVTEVVRGAIAAVREIAYGLRPPALDQLGLLLALENHCAETARRTGLEVRFQAVGMDDVPLSFDAEINLYRMVQEALNNTARHARASRVAVRMVKSHPELLVRIEDNGQGFDVDRRMAEALAENRMGLRSMEERARLVCGVMEIQSRVGTGTRIVFKIPLDTLKRSA